VTEGPNDLINTGSEFEIKCFHRNLLSDTQRSGEELNMRKAITVTLMMSLNLLGIGSSASRTAAAGPDDSTPSLIAGPDPFLYAPLQFPTDWPLRVPAGGALAPDAAPNRLLDSKMFDSLSSAGQRGVLIRSGMIERRNHPGARLIAQEAPPNLDLQENVRVTDAKNDLPGHGHTHSETSICANGNNIVESFNQTGQDSSSGYAFSTDGGRTFAQGSIPQDADQITLGDGVVALGPEGEIYYATLELIGGNLKSSVGVAKSTDGGATFGFPVNAATAAVNNVDFQDKEWIAVDRSPNSPFKGNVYVTWTDFADTRFINFSRSVDGGATFSKPIALSNRGPSIGVQGSNIAVGPNGQIHVVFFDQESDPNTGVFLSGIAYVESTDGGRHFTQPRLIAPISPSLTLTQVTGIGNVRANSFPSIAAAPNGDLHMVYGARPVLLGRDRSDVFYIRSTDGGATFSAARKLNDDDTSTTQLFPSVAVTATGAVGVKWWDRRNDPTFDSLTDVFMTISTDRGASFGSNFRVTNQNWLFGPIERNLATAYHGDYDGIAADGNDFFVPWSDERDGNPNAYFARVPANRDPVSPDFVVTSQKLYDSVIAGTSADFAIRTDAVGGFSDAVVLNAFPPAPDLAVSFDRPSAGIGQQVSLRILTSPDTQAGTHLFTVTATGGGKTRATSLWLNVLPRSGPYVSPPYDLSRTPGYTYLSSQPQLGPDGNIHLAFYDDTDLGPAGYKAYYARSTDGGRTYSKGVQLSRPGEQSYSPVVKIDSNGNIFVAWPYSKDEVRDGKTFLVASSVAVAVSNDGGETFSAPVDISPAQLEAPSLVGLEVNDDGSLLIIYGGVDADGLGVFAVQSANGGKSFGQPVRISSPGLDATGLAEVSDGKGGLLVAYSHTDFMSFQTSVFVCKSTDAGKTFFAPVLITPPHVLVPQSIPLRLALGSDGTAYVVYYGITASLDPRPGFIDLSNPSIVFTSAPDGKSFSVSRVIASFAYYPSMMLDQNGTIYVTYFEFAATPGGATWPIMLTRSCDKGASFSIPINASGANGFSIAATAISIDSNGILSLAWPDRQYGPSPQIALSTSVDGGVTFSPSTNVSSNQGASAAPFLLGHGDGSLSAFWAGDAVENRDLFSAVLARPAAAEPDYALIDQPLTVPRNTSGKLVVSISRPGRFGGSVAVSAPSDLPRGITVSPSQVSTITTNATFDLTVAKKHIQPGTYNLVFTGKDDAGREKSATIALTVE
jgi:hypothetical protein